MAIVGLHVEEACCAIPSLTHRIQDSCRAMECCNDDKPSDLGLASYQSSSLCTVRCR
jgi:hypothetical protein